MKELITDTFYLDALVEKERVKEITEALKKELNALDKVYLCSNEIGYGEKAFALKADDQIIVYFGPMFTAQGDIGLVSLVEDDVNYLIPRFKTCSISYLNENGEERTNSFSDIAAAIVHTAMDKLEGVSVSDYGLELTEEFEKASDEEKEEVVKAYIEAISNLGKQLDEDLSKDEDTARLWTNYKFNDAVKNGEVEFEEVEKPNRKIRRFLDKLARRSKKK